MTYSQEARPFGLYSPDYEHESCGVGFVADIRKRASHKTVEDARTLLVNMTHRGAVGSDKDTGDGAGVMTTLPQRFLERVAHKELGVTLPEWGRYSAGLVFLPMDEDAAAGCRSEFESIVEAEGQRVLGWRNVPVRPEIIGPTARGAMPRMQQVFIAAGADSDANAFEKALYLIRKQATRRIRGSGSDTAGLFYMVSLSTRVLVYKGMLTPEQLFEFFPDLTDPAFETHLALVHSRFSTNTFPSWDRAQPLRFMCHNGEINTLQGNANKMRAREGVLESSVFGPSLSRSMPVIEADQSDSGTFDNVLELLLMTGYTLQEAVLMMVPEAWQNHGQMDPDRKAMYEFFSTMMEPWDGPASIAFTDGNVVGAVLDRNGLRPSRYYVTTDDQVIMSSEVGALDLDPSNVREKGRLQPGRMFLVNFDEGRIVSDEEIKGQFACKRPYGSWISRGKFTVNDLEPVDASVDEPVRLADHAPDYGEEVQGFDPTDAPEGYGEAFFRITRAFGYTSEHLDLILGPMIDRAKEPIGSMGNDAPLACLSERPRLLYEYFKQLFAQVTNPPIDSIREELIMSLSAYVGPEGNLLEPAESHAERLWLESPILTDDELRRLKHMNHRGWTAKTIDITYPKAEGHDGMMAALDRIATEAETAIRDGYRLVILSDRALSRDRAALSALMATGTVHHYLVRNALRTQIGILVESGEPREVHHFCCLIGYGADGVNPYLAYAVLRYLRDQGKLSEQWSDADLEERYETALAHGMRKVFGKMGISTLDSYKGAQIFEAIGLKQEVIDRCFTGTATRIEGVGFAELAEENKRRHEIGYPSRPETIGAEFYNPGDYFWRTDGEQHMWDPTSIMELQVAGKQNNAEAYRRFSDRQNARTAQQATLRGLLRIRRTGESIPIDEVEPVEAITRRFATGAMSFGSISKETHETLAIALNRLGGKSNTGEGGEDPERYKPLPGGDSKRSAIKQVASGRFGVNIQYLTESDEIQIKMAQGAKPGEGGELPGKKVSGDIAKTRFSTPGVGLISPPPHHDIYSIEDLAQLIFDLKNANPTARISVKLVSAVGVGTVAAGVSKAHADHILISGQDGGTGASPLTGIKHAGIPWELGLTETHQTLVLNDLRTRVVVQTDGQLKTGRDVAVAAMLGAEEFGFSTSALIVLGCIMLRNCEKNTCSVGIATQDERLRARYTGKPEHVVNYFRFVAEELRGIMADLGVRTVDELVGRTDLLEVDDSVHNWKSRGVDLSALLYRAEPQGNSDRVVCCVSQDHGIESVLDQKLLDYSMEAIETGESIHIEHPIRNTDRCVGGLLSHGITRRRGASGLPDDTIHVKFNGSAGQTFGGWLARGVTLELEGDANDYVGKGLSGGRLIVYPPETSPFAAEENIVIGNVALYGATAGEGFFRGVAAERFCVRNSGAYVVVEGTGDHGCEYMTGGRAVILGPVGRNFAAGMSGGIAYVWDPGDRLSGNTNFGMVEILELNSSELAAPERYEKEVFDLIERHVEYTESAVGRRLIDDWDTQRSNMRIVVSPTYRQILETQMLRDRRKEVVHG